MRLGTFVAILTSLAIVLAIGVPVPYGPDPIPGEAGPIVRHLPMCLELRAADTKGDRPPNRVRLLAHDGPFRGTFTAQTDGSPAEFIQPWWRPAGRDSIDIGWHHSPIVRLPWPGDSVIGRSAPAGIAPLIWPFLGMPDTRIAAHRVPCTRFVSQAL
jgi:hypothetical protein